LKLCRIDQSRRGELLYHSYHTFFILAVEYTPAGLSGPVMGDDDCISPAFWRSVVEDAFGAAAEF
jgi:hypothetical protein